jgi:parallel beta-helix repeat protein
MTQILSVAGNVLTLREPCPVILPVANAGNSFLANSYITNVKVTGLTLACAWGGTPTRASLLEFVRTRDCTAASVRVVFTGGEGVASAKGIFGNIGRNLQVTDCFAEGVLKTTTAMGLRVASVTNATVKGCTTRNCSTGISVESGPDSTIIGNRCFGSSTSGGRGIKVVNPGTGVVVSGNVVDGFLNASFTGIQVDDAWNVAITGNTIRNTAESGIAIVGSTTTLTHSCTVTGNTISRTCQTAGTGAAIKVTVGAAAGSASGKHTITGNMIDGVANSRHGIFLGCSDCTVSGNTINNCGGQGIKGL